MNLLDDTLHVFVFFSPWISFQSRIEEKVFFDSQIVPKNQNRIIFRIDFEELEIFRTDFDNFERIEITRVCRIVDTLQSSQSHV